MLQLCSSLMALVIDIIMMEGQGLIVTCAHVMSNYVQLRRHAVIQNIHHQQGQSASVVKVSGCMHNGGFSFKANISA